MTDEDRDALLNVIATDLVNVRMDLKAAERWGSTGNGVEAYTDGFDDALEVAVHLVRGHKTQPPIEHTTKDEIVAEARRQAIRWRQLLNRLGDD